jgi:hypothetical protein
MIDSNQYARIRADRRKKGRLDPNRVASVNYDVRRLADEAEISVTQALALIAKHGDDPEILMREAKKLKG